MTFQLIGYTLLFINENKINFFSPLYQRSAEPQNQNRKQSLDDINLDQFLKIANYEDTVKELDVYYGIGMCLFI